MIFGEMLAQFGYNSVTLVNSIRYPDACGAFEWAAQGFRTDRPYGVGNISLYREVPKAFSELCWESYP